MAVFANVEVPRCGAYRVVGSCNTFAMLSVTYKHFLTRGQGKNNRMSHVPICLPLELAEVKCDCTYFDVLLL